MRTRRAFTALLFVFALAATDTRAAIEALNDNARVALPAPTSAFNGGSNSLFVWVYRAPGAGTRGIVNIPGAISVLTNNDGDASATIHFVGNAGPQSLSLFLADAIPENEWTLVTVSVDRPGGEALLAVESVSRGMRSHAVQAGEPVSAGPASGDATIGAFDGHPSMLGVFGIVVLRDHSVTVADAQGLFAQRRHFGPFEADTLAEGGRMTGSAGARWMVNHGLFAQPTNASGQQYNNGQIASAPDRAARRSDYVVWNRSAAVQPDSLRVIRPVTACDSFWYRSPFDIDPGFFARVGPTPTTPLPPNPVAAVSPRARRLAEMAPPVSGPPMRVMASANSRGVKVQDALGSPANYAHGMTDALRPHVAGIIMRPSRLSDVGPYFGIHTTSGADNRVRRSADCIVTESTNFARFWTGTLTPTAVGPGAGVLLPQPGSYYSLRCRPEEGSLLRADARLTVRVYMLKYPGAPAVNVYADVGPTQNAAGQQTPLGSVDLDTSSPALTTTVTSVTSASAFDIPGDRTSGPNAITQGMAVAIATGSTRNDISVVAGVQYIGGANTTRVTLEHPFIAAPDIGAQALFGAHGIEIFEHIHGPAAAPNLWRGLEVRVAGDASDLAAVLYAFDAFNPDDGGFAVGPAGWSGRGYQRQIEDSFASGLRNCLASAGADLWLSYIAHQFSEPQSMAWFTDELRAATPDIEIGWIACVDFDGTYHGAWQRYILENAKPKGVVGLTVLDHPTLGTYRDLGADGAMVDGAHPTARGHKAIANAALDVLKNAARWPGDANNDAVVNFADLNLVLVNFGMSGANNGSLPGDVNISGGVDFADLNAVLSNLGTSAFH